MNWSHFQRDIFDAFEHSQESLLIEAVAGSGKTSTLVELANIMQRAFPQQRAVMVAFNKSIAMELEARITARNVQAMTLHSAGWAAWRRAGGLEWTPKVDSGKVSGIMRDVLSYEDNKRFGDTTRRLVGYAKAAGLVPDAEGYVRGVEINITRLKGLVADSADNWEAMIDHYGLDEGDCNVELVRKVLARSIELARDSCDFDDMLYMPVVTGVPFDRWDVVLVDEAQDVSGIQMEMIGRMVAQPEGSGICGCGDSIEGHPNPMNCGHSPVEQMYPGGRVIAVGDRAQAIYGFRGAGHNSMDELRERFQMRELPLSVSYRCPQAVVLHARQWVRQIEYSDAAEAGYVGLEGTDWQGQAEVALGAPSEEEVIEANAGRPDIGVLSDWGAEQIRAWGITKWRGAADFLPGDAVLCRLTRPLVAAAFGLIRRRVACHVLGRDIGKGLTALITKSKLPLVAPVEAFARWLDDYEHREGERLRNRGKHAQAGLLADKADTLRVFIAEAGEDGTVAWLVREVEALFSDENGGGVTLATIHKAKGLEWARVFVLDASELMPCRWARQQWEMVQERNLMYVAATRAKRELRYITSWDLGVAGDR